MVSSAILITKRKAILAHKLAVIETVNSPALSTLKIQTNSLLTNSLVISVKHCLSSICCRGRCIYQLHPLQRKGISICFIPNYFWLKNLFRRQMQITSRCAPFSQLLRNLKCKGLASIYILFCSSPVMHCFLEQCFWTCLSELQFSETQPKCLGGWSWEWVIECAFSCMEVVAVQCRAWDDTFWVCLNWWHLWQATREIRYRLKLCR